MSMTNKVSPKSAILFFFRRHSVLYSALAVVLLCAAVLEALSVAALFPVMTVVLRGESVGGGRVLAVLQQMSQIVPSQDRLQATVVLLIGVITLKSVIIVLRDYLIASGGAKAVYGIKQEMFSRIAQAPYQYFLDRRQADLSYCLTTAPQGLGLTLLLIPSLLAQTLIVLAICVLLATISWQLTVGVIVFGAVLYGMLRQVSKRISHIVGQRRTLALTRELGIVMEFFSGVKEILSAGATNRWTRRYRQEGDELRRVHVKDSVWQSVPAVLIEWAFFVLIGVMAIALQANRGVEIASAIPMMAVYAYALYRLIRAVSILSSYKLRLSGQLADVELLYKALHEPFPAVREGSITQLRFMSTITFDQVSFIYPNRVEHALRQISLTIPRGGVTALVGPSGAGKTTLVNLLLRLYDPTEGVIRVDGRDLREYRRESWLKWVGYVSQEVFILNGSVAENISFGLECPQEQIEMAARAAYAHEFISDLPLGYDTVVGDRGMTLSGGQRQRIAIARALLRKPDILVFDEATSALDSVSEALIQKAISELAEAHTLILVAHRLSTVRIANHIVVLDQGRVVEEGSHQDLIALKGQYSLMMASSLD